MKKLFTTIYHPISSRLSLAICLLMNRTHGIQTTKALYRVLCLVLAADDRLGILCGAYAPEETTIYNR